MVPMERARVAERIHAAWNTDPARVLYRLLEMRIHVSHSAIITPEALVRIIVGQLSCIARCGAHDEAEAATLFEASVATVPDLLHGAQLDADFTHAAISFFYEHQHTLKTIAFKA